jgi:hypothetical protein
MPALRTAYRIKYKTGRMDPRKENNYGADYRHGIQSRTNEQISAQERSDVGTRVPQGGSNRGSRIAVEFERTALAVGKPVQLGRLKKVLRPTEDPRENNREKWYLRHHKRYSSSMRRNRDYDSNNTTNTTKVSREDMQAIWQHLDITGCQVSYVGPHGQGLKTLNTTIIFTSVLSISGFVREPRCSNSVTWNP